MRDATTDNSGQITSRTEYDGYGVESLLSGTASVRGDNKWAGKAGYLTEPENGLVLMGHRYYHPVLGRFLTQDPIGLKGGNNLYAYVGNDPLSKLDPEGTQQESVSAYVRNSVRQILQDVAENPQKALQDIKELQETVTPPNQATVQFLERSVQGVERIASGVRITSRIRESAYAVRLAKQLPESVQKEVDRLLDLIQRGRNPLDVGIRGKYLEDGFIEVRGQGNARAIIRRVGARAYEVWGKFETHTGGRQATSDMINRLMRRGQ